MRAYLIPLAIIGATTATAALGNDFTMPTGSSRMVYYSLSVNEDCSSMGDDVIRITTPPTHGRAVVKSGLAHSQFPASNPRHVCNTRARKATTVWYTAGAGFVGDDFLTVDVIAVSGGEKSETISIHVK